MMFEGHDLAKISNRAMKLLRKDIQMIFQAPYTSLNPRHTVGAIIGTPLSVHDVVPKTQIMSRVQELIEVSGLNPVHHNRYTNEFSGGPTQHQGIAHTRPLTQELRVADETVTA